MDGETEDGSVGSGVVVADAPKDRSGVTEDVASAAGVTCGETEGKSDGSVVTDGAVVSNGEIGVSGVVVARSEDAGDGIVTEGVIVSAVDAASEE
jgi:hypothetical protein